MYRGVFMHHILTLRLRLHRGITGFNATFSQKKRKKGWNGITSYLKRVFGFWMIMRTMCSEYYYFLSTLEHFWDLALKKVLLPYLLAEEIQIFTTIFHIFPQFHLSSAPKNDQQWKPFNYITSSLKMVISFTMCSFGYSGYSYIDPQCSWTETFLLKQWRSSGPLPFLEVSDLKTAK